MATFIVEPRRCSPGDSSSTGSGDSPRSWSPAPNDQPGAGLGFASILMRRDVLRPAGLGVAAILMRRDELRPAGLGVAPFENGQYVRLLNRGRGGYLFADESGEGLSTDRRRGMVNTAWCVQILEGDPVHVMLRGAYGRHLAATPMGAGDGHIGSLAAQRVLDTMADTQVRTFPGSRAGDVLLLNGNLSNPNGVLRGLRANGRYRRWNRGVTIQPVGHINWRLSSMMMWEVQVIPTRVQRPPLQLGRAARLSGPRRQVGIGMADNNGNFNGPCEVNISFA